MLSLGFAKIRASSARELMHATNTLPMLARSRSDERDVVEVPALPRTDSTEADLAAQKLSRLAVLPANPQGFYRFDL